MVNFLETIIRWLEKIPGFSGAAAKWDLRFSETLRGIMDVPRCPQKLSGETWGLCVLFGTVEKKIHLKNFSAFRARNRKQGLKLLVVEQVLPGQEFLLTPHDADIVIQIRGGDILWQKERLLNLALERLPKECDKVICLDIDTIFLNEDWVEETARLLEKYVVVQPFKNIFWVDQEQSEEILADPYGRIKIRRHADIYLGAAYRMSLKRFGLWPRQTEVLFGDPGYAIAFRRSVLADGGFYEKMVLGGGDRVMMQSLYHPFDEELYRREPLYDDHFPPERYRDLSAWSRNVFEKVQKSVFFTEGTLVHLWHGEKEKRKYFPRLNILTSYGFDPEKDIRLDEGGCWVWATDKKDMHRAVAEYFKLRV